MKRYLKSNFFSFVLGAIIFGSIGIASAYTFLASDVEFIPQDTTWNVNNTKDAIDDLQDQIKISNYTGSFYLCGDVRANYSRYAYMDINVEKYRKMTINVTYVYNEPGAFTFNIIADGTTILNISKINTYNIDVSNYKNIRFYYYENYGYMYAGGTYTLYR